jgi:lysine 2,3-aminomutase
MKNKIETRGLAVMLEHGGLPEIVSPYILKLIEETGGVKGPIGLQFIAQPEKERGKKGKDGMDPLVEDEHEVAPGLVYKYRGKKGKDGKIIYFGRVLWTVTRFCATYCRFCTRGREVGISPAIKTTSCARIAQKAFLSDEEIEEVFKFLKRHKEINEVIISGGDPLVMPETYLSKIVDGLSALQKSGDIDILRLGTRLPIVNPDAIKDWHYNLLGKIKHLNLMVHINHPAELTEKSIKILESFIEKSGVNVNAQTVFLKGVNDSVEVLYELFMKMAKNGIRPYYLFQNDAVNWATHFTVPIKKGINIWKKLRPRLSGIVATARFVIDTPFGYGKIPVPEGDAWDVDYSSFTDFKRKKHHLFN